MRLFSNNKDGLNIVIWTVDISAERFEKSLVANNSFLDSLAKHSTLS